MDTIKKNTEGVERCLERVRIENPGIGVYLEHSVAPSGESDYMVRVSNGRLLIPIDIAEDFCNDPERVHKQMIDKITNSFQPV